VTFRSTLVTERGAGKVQIVEKPLREPAAGEARIRILATAVAQDDIAVQAGTRPVLPKLPFVPGYSFVGSVDAVGAGVSEVATGDRVAALTQFGSHAEVIYWPASELVRVPDGLDAAATAPLILNYLVAYQVLHRVAKVKANDTVLIVGASGGCGTALLQLGRVAGLKMYGLASRGKHHILHEHGATAIDYQSEDFVDVLRQTEPNGIDFVFNGMDADTFECGLKVLRRGGTLVHFGGPASMRGLLWLVAKLLFYNLLPNGKTIKGYGTHRLGVDTFKPDWNALFDLLAHGEIQPLIATIYPILEAPQAYAMLESGQVVGNVVLLTPESGICRKPSEFLPTV
jgi:NADPH2:quinone reductase